MKDSLHREPTAYEILSVERRATAAEIEAAFKAGMVQRRNVHDLMTARKTLQSPEERALLDLLHYDTRALSRLRPNPIGDGVIMQPVNRAATGKVWQAQLATAFPDPNLTHCLGVFFYWWALYEEGRVMALLHAAGPCAGMPPEEASKRTVLQVLRKGQGCEALAGETCEKSECAWREDCRASAPTLRALWERVIACWVSMAMDVKSGRLTEGAARPDAVYQQLMGWLRTTLHDLGQRYREAGFADLAANYVDLELLLASEERTATHMAGAGIRINNKPVTSGLMMLRMTGMTKSVREQVNAALKRSPRNADLTALQQAVSSYAAIVVLIESRKLEEAIRAIEQLSPRRRATEEVLQLHMRALWLLGQQRVELNQLQGALDAWARALTLNANADIVAEIRRSIVSMGQERSAAMQKHRRDEAIALLERARGLVEDEKLRLTLAELLARRGVDVFSKTQDEAKRAKGRFTQPMLERLRGAMADLERAAQLGSKFGADQVDAARGILKDAEEVVQSNLFELPPDVVALIEEAQEAAGNRDYNRAVEALRRALQMIAPNAPRVLNARLSNYLANRGIDRGNEALKHFSAEGERQQPLQRRLSQALETGGSFRVGLCAMCGEVIYGSYYTFSNRDGRSAQVCGACGTALNAEISRKPRPSRETQSLLQSAYEDLLEATELDDSNAHAATNLDILGQRLAELDVKPARKRAGRRRPARTAAQDSANDAGGQPQKTWRAWIRFAIAAAAVMIAGLFALAVSALNS